MSSRIPLDAETTFYVSENEPMLTAFSVFCLFFLLSAGDGHRDAVLPLGIA